MNTDAFEIYVKWSFVVLGIFCTLLSIIWYRSEKKN